MTMIAAAMSKGWQLHQSGDIRQAEQMYREVLKADAAHVDALYLLGVVCQNLGDLAEAEKCYRRALEVKPDHSDVHCNLGVVYARQGRLDQAIACYREAIRCKPENAAPHNNLGLDLAAQGRLDEAIASFREAVRLKPSYAEAYENLRGAEAARQDQLGLAANSSHFMWAGGDRALDVNNQAIDLWRQGRLDEAVGRFQHALTLRPTFAEAYFNLGLVLVDRGELGEAAACYQQALRFQPSYPEALNNLGNARRQQGRLDEAATCYRQALQLWPDYAAAHNNLAVILDNTGSLDEAVFHYREALRLSPDMAAAHNNLGVVYERQGKLDEAAACYRDALRLQPDFADAHNNLGNVFRDELRLDEAEECYARALGLRPDFADAHLNRGLLSLLRGNWAAGWSEYEWRWRRIDMAPRFSHIPRWNGSPLNGRSILLHAEQGLGDTIHFARYAELVRRRGGRVVLECQPALQRLLTRCPGIDQIIPQGMPVPPCDVQAPLLSLPGIFGTALDSIPAPASYLSPNPALVERWRARLLSIQAFKIGIAWHGNPSNRDSWQRSIPLACFAPLGSVPGTQLISLQKGQGTEQAASLAGRHKLIDFGPELDEESGPFMDTAALMMGLDLIVTTDTAVAHLAGALGVRAWVALSFSPDWRWLLGREDSPWYPSLRLFRQTQLAHWDDVFERMASTLSKQRAGPTEPEA